MTAKNDTAKIRLKIAEHYPAVAPIIEREFKRICPTLTLNNFNGDGKYHWIRLTGTEAELLRMGVIDSSMIAVRPKRVFRRYSHGIGIESRRLAGDRVEVRLDLGRDLDPTHPLAPLAASNWETIVKQSEPPPGPHTAPEWRELALESIDSTLGHLESWEGKCWRGRLDCVNPRFRFAVEDISRMESIIHRFRKEIIGAMEVAKVVDIQARAPNLRVVVSNDATVQP